MQFPASRRQLTLWLSWSTSMYVPLESYLDTIVSMLKADDMLEMSASI